ncbi:hypothetical protein HK100_007327 [Physocladia obscura]|uniref:NIPSNAP domain-containing protein n=1 Tax=Physocladia obscura TaxID=109957 RepID=A0AAD5SRS6_9FUNG|nr:hypothetical protein HK100_007327 [Physocladia obscura]
MLVACSRFAFAASRQTTRHVFGSITTPISTATGSAGFPSRAFSSSNKASNSDANSSSPAPPPTPPRKGLLGSLLHGRTDDDDGAPDEAYFNDSQSKLAARGKYPEAWDDYTALISDYYPKVSNNPDYKMKLFGSWHTEIGKLDQVVHIWQYDNYPGYDGSIALRHKDEVRNEFMRKLRPMITSRENQIMLEFDFWYTSEPFNHGGIYELRTYNLKPGRLLEWKLEW